MVIRCAVNGRFSRGIFFYLPVGAADLCASAAGPFAAMTAPYPVASRLLEERLDVGLNASYPIVKRSTMNAGTIENLHGLIEAVHQAREMFGGELDSWWRGHGQETWALVPRVHRETRSDRYEKNIAIRFYNRALTRHSRCPAPKDFPGWLSFMQHYGLPTRLLDWSESPLIAAFFVANNPKRDSEPGALWVLQPSLLNEAEGMSRALRLPESKDVRQLYQPPFSDVNEVDRIAAVLVPEQDIRMLVQLSTHTIHGSDRALETHEHRGRFLMRWVVPATAKSRLRTELDLLGIRTSTVFPDLEHLSKELIELQFSPIPEEALAATEG